MKLQGARIERFLAAPDPAVGAVLLFGPDEGLARERAEQLIRTVLDQPDDPFRLSELMADQLRADPARLPDEARALTLMGGRRVVRVRQASDLVTPACRSLLQLDRFDALVVVEAGDLPPGSSLRKLFEGARQAMALPCYRDLARDLASLIRTTLREHGLEAEPDALDYLVDHLGGDRALTRSELDKLLLYLGAPAEPGSGSAQRGRPKNSSSAQRANPEDSGERRRSPDEASPARPRVTLEQAAAVIGDTSALGIDDLIDAVALGEFGQLQRCLDRLLREGQHPVRLVRSLANHLVRLDRLGSEARAGAGVETAVERARPPIHFRRRERVKAALRRWPPERLGGALGVLVEVEVQCKSTGRPAELICRDAMLKIARLARPG